MLERLIRFSIQNRWLVLALTLGAAALGAHSLSRLPIDAVPDITNNQVQINTLAPSLAPFEIEKQVTVPIETSLAGIPGLQSTRSLSRNGFSQITAVFEDRTDIYFARQQVMERIDAARENLPPEVEPKMGPISTGLGEVYMYTVGYAEGADRPAAKDGEPGWQTDGAYMTPEGEVLRDDFEKIGYLRTVQDWIIRPQLKTVKNVAGIDSIGGYEQQYHVMPDPMKLAAHRFTFHDVIEALERNNVGTGMGYIEHKGETYTVRSDGRAKDVEDIAAIALGMRGGTPVYLRDVAAVGPGRELRTGAASQNGAETVVGTALMLIGSNSRTVAADVEAKLVEIRKSLPPGIVARTALNRTLLVDQTIATVRKNLTEGALLVVAVLFLLLGNLRAACIAALAIPLAMLLTATGMVGAKVSGNLMSLGALDFGIIVDGAVIVVENCLRRLAERQAALRRQLTLQERLHEVMEASRQMIQPSVFGQAVLITAYMSILALTGIEGKMFHPMALTVIFALIASLVLSLTFVPAMVAIFIRGRVGEHENWFVAGAKRIYAPLLRAALRARYATVGAAVLCFVGGLILFSRLGQEFVPTLNEGDLAVQAMRIPSTSLTQSMEMQLELEKKLSQMPEVAFVFSKTGTAEVASDPMPPSISDTFVMLKPRRVWPDPKEDKNALIERIEELLRPLPGNNYEFTQPIQMRFNELMAGVRGDLSVKVYGDDFAVMAPIAQKIAAALAEVPGAADVKAEQTEGLPFMDIRLDRDAMSRRGLSAADVQEVAAIALGGREAGHIFRGDRPVDLVVRLPDALREDIEALERLPIPLPDAELASADETANHTAAYRAPRGNYVPLGEVASVALSEGPNQVSRENGKRRIVVQANVRGRDIASFVAEAQRRIDAEVKLAPGVWLAWGGQFENLIAARNRLSIVAPLCLLVILMLLFMTFNSVKFALIVFSGVPLALSGGALALWLCGLPFSISAAVGFVALSGIAVMNGLVMVTYINHLRKKGAGLEEAIERGSITRLRPVLMTALVETLGFLPMALASGAGAEVQKPLATVVIGGIVTSTLLTLLVLPALYRIWNRDEPIGGPADDEEHLVEAEPIVV